MKTTKYLLILLIFSLFSCEKELIEDVTRVEVKEAPCGFKYPLEEIKWLSELHKRYVEGDVMDKNLGKISNMATINLYSYNDVFYFQVESGLFSCVACNIYRCDGSLIQDVDTISKQGYMRDRELIQTLWKSKYAR
ncbi:hypothetical protein VB776_16925 [Arcicella sp. DC2W]|uniref:Lipoprotein n=1 Tax=Arcicella gelida TaxID=2984195 RepID=A0ABU5S875_9BACT|nr:hypothetical protein [Arcicella sp. DC2W]MEA5404619.1 hypothetical protein [Arcicella sp. DC2W]